MAVRSQGSVGPGNASLLEGLEEDEVLRECMVKEGSIETCSPVVKMAHTAVQGISSQCCGMMFNSRGFKSAAATKGAELEAALVKASQGGKLPIVVDTSPCLANIKGALSDPSLRWPSAYLLTIIFISPISKSLHIFCHLCLFQ